MTREYRYVGPTEIAAEAEASIDRLQPQSPEDIRRWRLVRGSNRVELTYVVDPAGSLWLSDRRTEHVACARGRHVLAAGEIALDLRPDDVVVTAVSNQSTGYCPEPACWPAVRVALVSAGLRPPSAFTHEFNFRRCERCGTINVLKEDCYECGTCEAELPREWNLNPAASAG